ncbi:MAG TPA: 2-amino-4-hydroxy-6-hydroxymethyldihydropteridine diphosphokinase [Rhodocyclaceae bacterium]
MSLAFVALGANLGDPMATLKLALQALDDLPQSRLTATSSFYRTAPVGLKNQPDFINAVAALETGLDADALLDALFAIEGEFGRQRSVPNAPRTLDLDLLLFEAQCCDSPRLTLPHPRMHQRAFVLAPLAEIAPNLAIPGHGPVAALLAACSEQRIEAMKGQQ